jgi:serine protease Do
VPAARRAGPLLRVAHVGQYAPHDRAKRAGVRKGDVLLSFDGRADFARETDVIRHGLEPEQKGRAVPLEVQRGAQTLTLTLPAE